MVPGLGMGQWGAFGYATLEHKTYQWILGHYYGGTTLWSGTSVVSNDPTVSVDINANDGHPVVVTSGSAFTFGGHSFLPGQAATPSSTAGEWSLSQAPSCSSTKWSPVASQLVNPVAVPSSLQAFGLLEPGSDDLRARGSSTPCPGDRAGFRRAARSRDVDVLPLEEYVLGVVSAEVTWSWGLWRHKGVAPKGGLGLPGPEAQAVATRSTSPPRSSRAGWQPTPPPVTPTASPTRA